MRLGSGVHDRPSVFCNMTFSRKRNVPLHRHLTAAERSIYVDVPELKVMRTKFSMGMTKKARVTDGCAGQRVEADL